MKANNGKGNNASRDEWRTPSWIFIPDKRVSYEGLDGDGARFPSALIGVGVPPPKDINGIILKPSLHNSQKVKSKQ